MSSVYGSTMAGAARADIAAWMTAAVPYLPGPVAAYSASPRWLAADSAGPRWPAASGDRAATPLAEATARLAEVGRSRIARARGLSALRRKRRRAGQHSGPPFPEQYRAPARRRPHGLRASLRT